MFTCLVIAVIVLWLTACVATRYLIDLPLRLPGANFSEWAEELFWLVMWPIPLITTIWDYHRTITPPGDGETAGPPDLESAETDKDAEGPGLRDDVTADKDDRKKA